MPDQIVNEDGSIETPVLGKQEIELEVNHLAVLAEMDDEMLKKEPNGFLISFGTGFHIFQQMRAECGSHKMNEVLGHIIAVLTNPDFQDAYSNKDSELLGSFWFNFDDITKQYFQKLVERLIGLGF